MKFLNKLSPYAHWLLRLPLAAVFLYAGIMKFTGGIEGFAQAMNLPVFIAVLVALAEVGGGAFILLGGALKKDLLTRVGGLFITIVMIGALVMVKFNAGWPAMELDVVLLALALYFAIRGNK